MLRPKWKCLCAMLQQICLDYHCISFLKNEKSASKICQKNIAVSQIFALEKRKWVRAYILLCQLKDAFIYVISVKAYSSPVK